MILDKLKNSPEKMIPVAMAFIVVGLSILRIGLAWPTFFSPGCSLRNQLERFLSRIPLRPRDCHGNHRRCPGHNCRRGRRKKAQRVIKTAVALRPKASDNSPDGPISGSATEQRARSPCPAPAAEPI